MSELLRLSDVISTTQLSKASVYRLIIEAGFPRPLRVGLKARPLAPGRG